MTSSPEDKFQAFTRAVLERLDELRRTHADVFESPSGVLEEVVSQCDGFTGWARKERARLTAIRDPDAYFEENFGDASVDLLRNVTESIEDLVCVAFIAWVGGKALETRGRTLRERMSAVESLNGENR